MARTVGQVVRKKKGEVQQEVQEMKENRSSKRQKTPTSPFKFEGNHSLFSDTTRRYEENQKKRTKNIEKQKKFQNEKRESRLKEELKQVKSESKKKDRKIKNQEKKIKQLSKKDE